MDIIILLLNIDIACIYRNDNVPITLNFLFIRNINEISLHRKNIVPNLYYKMSAVSHLLMLIVDLFIYKYLSRNEHLCVKKESFM